MVKVVYRFKDYTPIEVNLASEQDVINLNIIIHYLMQGAKVYHDSSTNDDVQNYFVDMSWEDKEDKQ